MHLYFLRHGEADWPEWDRPDDERPLTRRGKKEMEKVARFLSLLGVEIDQVISSPLPRAKQTAEIVAHLCKWKLHENAILKPGFQRAGLKRLLKNCTDSSVMLVGHEPDFTGIIRALTGAELKLSKAGLALLYFDPSSVQGRLLWLFPPKIAKARS